MEDLTQDTGHLSTLCHTFGLEIPVSELKRLQSKDINRKVVGDRKPQTLWNLWSREQQDAFRCICGPRMEELNYELP